MYVCNFKGIVIYRFLSKRKEEGSKGKTIEDIWIKDEAAPEPPRSTVCLSWGRCRDWVYFESIIIFFEMIQYAVVDK
jgi:hypothetical protein